MFKRLFIYSILLASLFCGLAVVQAAGTAVKTKDEVIKQTSWSRPIRVITWRLSSTSGTSGVSGSTVKAEGVTGVLMGILATTEDPPTQPDDDYDITIVTDSNGEDILNGAGADLPKEKNSVENRRTPVDFLNDGPILIFNEDIYPVATNFNTSDSANSTITLYVLLP